MTAHETSLPPDGTEPSGPPARPAARRGTAAALGATLLLIAAKGKVLVLALKPLLGGKALLMVGSMFAMIALEAMRGGWAFATGFVGLILVHELGHAVAIKRSGMQASLPVFIPFFGALISMKGQPRSPVVEADIALAGPVAGAAGALAVAAVYLLTGRRVLLAIAHAGFFLNLFNLTPLGFLDGGRVARVFWRRAWIAGIAIFAGLFIVTHAPQLLLIGVLALRQVFTRASVDAVVDVPAAERNRIVRNYLGLCVVLAAGTAFARSLLGG